MWDRIGTLQLQNDLLAYDSPFLTALHTLNFLPLLNQTPNALDSASPVGSSVDKLVWCNLLARKPERPLNHVCRVNGDQVHR